MKKYSKIALLMAALLSATTVISACDGNYVSSEPGGYNPEGPGPAITPIYKDLAAEWAKYVEYVSDEDAAKTVTATAITAKETDTDKNKPQTGVNVEAEENYVCTEETVYEYKDFPTKVQATNPETGELLYDETTREPIMVDGVPENKQVGTTTTERYTFTSGKTLTIVTKSFNKNGDKLVDETKNIADQETQQFVEDGVSTLYYVKTTKYVLKDPQAPTEPEGEEISYDAALVSSYDTVVTYTYYDKFGNEVVKDLSETVTVRSGAGITQAIVDIKDKTYLVQDGEIIETFELGMEHGIPTLDKEASQMVEQYGQMAFDASAYAYYAQGEYEYKVQDAQFYQQIVGELAMMVFPAVSIYAYKDNEFVAEYKAEADAIMGYAVLPNGSLYVCEYEYLPENSESYDLAFGTQKLNVNHKLINVLTGATTDVDQAFISTKVFTNSTLEIGTAMNATTLGTSGLYDNLKVKDGYVLAEIQKIEDKAVEGNTVFAVLNESTLEIVAELPKIVPNQFGYVGFMDEDHMLVQARTTENSILNYTVEVSTGELELFLHNIREATPVDGGFLYGKKVYDYDWQLIKDYTEEMDYEDDLFVWNGKVILWDVDTISGDSSNTYNFNLYYGAIGTQRDQLIANGETNPDMYWDQEYLNRPVFVTKSLMSSSYNNDNYDYQLATYNNVLAVTCTDAGMTRFFGVDGKEIVILSQSSGEPASFGGIGNVANEYEKDSTTKFVRYEVTKTVEVVGETADGLIVKTVEAWAEDEYDYYYGNSRQGYDYEEEPSAEVLAKDGKIYEQYYIVK